MSISRTHYTILASIATAASASLWTGVADTQPAPFNYGPGAPVDTGVTITAGAGIGVTGTALAPTVSNTGSITAGTGMSASGAPPTQTLTNTGSITAGTGIVVSGSAPNQTITATGTSTAGGSSGQFQVNSGGVLAGTTCASAGTASVSLACPFAVTSTATIVAASGQLVLTGLVASFPSITTAGAGQIALTTAQGMVFSNSVGFDLSVGGANSCQLSATVLTCNAFSTAGQMTAGGLSISGGQTVTIVNSSSTPVNVLSGGSTGAFNVNAGTGTGLNTLGNVNDHTLFGSPFVSAAYTVSTLPSTTAAGKVTGARAHVTDSTVCTFLGALTGGGSTFCPVIYNGSAWVGE